MAATHRNSNRTTAKANRVKARHRSAQRRSQTFTWLGAGVFTLGVGAALASGSGVAHASTDAAGKTQAASAISGTASGSVNKPASSTTKHSSSGGHPSGAPSSAAASGAGSGRPAALTHFASTSSTTGDTRGELKVQITPTAAPTTTSSAAQLKIITNTAAPLKLATTTKPTPTALIRAAVNSPTAKTAVVALAAPAAAPLNGVPVAVVVGALATIVLAAIVAPAIPILATEFVFGVAGAELVGAGAVGVVDVAAIGLNAATALLPDTVLGVLGGNTAVTTLGLFAEASTVSAFLADTTGILAGIKAIRGIITEGLEALSGEGEGGKGSGGGSGSGSGSGSGTCTNATCTVTTTGAVTGTVNFANGTNTYSVTTDPKQGTVILNPTTGAFTYIPIEAAQLTAGGTTDTFTETATKTGAPPSKDEITVPIIGATLKVTKTIPVGYSPIGLAVSPTGNDVYVGNINVNSTTPGDQVSVIDTNPADATNDTVVKNVPVGVKPNGVVGVAVSNTGADVYSTNNIDGTVSVINTATNSVDAILAVGNGMGGPTNDDPQQVATSSTGKAYVANNGSYGVGGAQSVTVIDTTSNGVDSTTSFPNLSAGVGPEGVAVSPNGQQVYVTIDGLGPNGGTRGTVDVLNANGGIVGTPITVGFNPGGVAVSPTGTLAYVTNQSSVAVNPTGNTGTVSVINTATNTVTDTIDVGGEPGGVAFSPDGSLAYVTESMASISANGTTVDVIDTATNEVIATVTVGTDPTGVAVAPNGTAYVTNEIGAGTSLQGTVSVISLVATG